MQLAKYDMGLKVPKPVCQVFHRFLSPGHLTVGHDRIEKLVKA